MVQFLHAALALHALFLYKDTPAALVNAVGSSNGKQLHKHAKHAVAETLGTVNTCKNIVSAVDTFLGN